jgi:hypothetical protein
MFKKIIYLSIFLPSITLQLPFAQGLPKEIFSLKKEQFSMPNRKFYIQKIVCDFKQPKYFLIRKGISLGDSLQTVLLHFLKPSNTYTGGQAPILIRVKDLKIREERHFLKEEGMAKISMEFYIETDSKPIKIFQSNAFRTYTSLLNVTPQHEENLRDIIKTCMLDFMYFRRFLRRKGEINC